MTDQEINELAATLLIVLQIPLFLVIDNKEQSFWLLVVDPVRVSHAGINAMDPILMVRLVIRDSVLAIAHGAN